MGCKKLLHRVREIEKERKEEKFKKEKRKRHLKKFIVLLVIALIAVGIYFFITGRLKGAKDVYDPGEISIEVSGMNSNGPVSSSIEGKYEFISLFAPAQYTVTMSALGDDCSYHYSGSKEGDLAIHGTRVQKVDVSGEEKSLVHVLTCTSSNGRWHAQKMLIVNVTPSKVETPALSATAK